jgi:hypothetical protein
VTSATLGPPAGAPADSEGPEAQVTPVSQRVVPPSPALSRGGYCSEHPGEALRKPRALGMQWDSRPLPVVCPSPEHDPYTRDRCRWCGGPLFGEGGLPVFQSARRAFCSNTCRNYFWRARQRARVKR